MRKIYDTPSGLIKHQTRIYNHFTPSEFSGFDHVLGYGLKYPDAFQNMHLGVIGK